MKSVKNRLAGWERTKIGIKELQKDKCIWHTVTVTLATGME